MNINILAHCFYSYKFSPSIVILVCIAALASWLVLSHESMLALVAEFGIVENMTVVFYLIAIVIIWLPVVIATSSFVVRLCGTIILLAMAAREIDLHKYISGISMFKLRFWTGDFPLSEKILSVLIILPIALSLIYLFVKYYKLFFNALKSHRADSVTLMTFIVVMGVAKFLDRSLNVITEIKDWQVPIWLVALQNAFEEYFELLLPILIIIYIFQYMGLDKNNKIPEIKILK